LMLEKRQADTDARTTKNLPETAAAGEAVPQEPRAAIRLPLALGRTYERFLELPPAFVLTVMWLVGAALLGSLVLLLYSTGWVLVQSVARAI
jgi:hypothetical protein